MTVRSEPSAAYSLEKLIVLAFRTARDRGKPDWRTMTLAVLKNRLLQLSRGAFHEHKHGVQSFRELLEQYPELVRLVEGSVELLPAEALESAESSDAVDGRVRVRPDLWRATMDYATGKKYAWDSGRGCAREAHENDLLLLPTLTSEEMRAWREEFASTRSPTTEVDRWKSEGLGTRDLPPGLRGPWNGFVRERVSARLTRWFTERQLDVPTIVEAPRVLATPAVEQVREVVAACVAVMTADELAELRLPPTAVLRAKLAGRLS
jgi:hypothetical protein